MYESNYLTKRVIQALPIIPFKLCCQVGFEQPLKQAVAIELFGKDAISICQFREFISLYDFRMKGIFQKEDTLCCLCTQKCFKSPNVYVAKIFFN